MIEIYEGNSVSQRIFVGGGFAEVNEKGCTVLAEEAVRVGDIDTAEAEKRIKLARDDLASADDDVTKAKLERDIEIAEAMIEAAKSSGGGALILVACPGDAGWNTGLGKVRSDQPASLRQVNEVAAPPS